MPSNLQTLIGLEEGGYDAPNMPSSALSRTHVVCGKDNDDHDERNEEGENQPILEHIVTSVSICFFEVTHVFTCGVTLEGNSRKLIYCSVQAAS